MKKLSSWILGFGVFALALFVSQQSFATLVRLQSLEQLTNNCGPSLIVNGEITKAQSITDNSGWPSIIYTFNGLVMKQPSGGYALPFSGKTLAAGGGENTFQIKMYGRPGQELIRGFAMPPAGVKGLFFISGAAKNSGNAGFCGGPQGVFKELMVDGKPSLVNAYGNSGLELKNINLSPGEGPKFQALQKSLGTVQNTTGSIPKDDFLNIVNHLIEQKQGQ